MPKKIFVLAGHPDSHSLTHAIANSYKLGAEAAGHVVKMQTLDDMVFDPVLYKGYNQIQELEPDLLKSQENILWCDHWVIVQPLWWGAAPASLKGFFDRVLLPGFAFQYLEGKSFPGKLLSGRSARVIIMSDTPTPWLNYVYGGGWVRILKKQILGFCGLSPVKISHLNTVRSSSDKLREKWLVQINDLGQKGL